MECMQAGKHVLLEKPMAINLEQCKDLIAEGKRRHDSSGQVFMVSENAQYWPEVGSATVCVCGGGGGGWHASMCVVYVKGFVEL